MKAVTWSQRGGFAMVDVADDFWRDGEDLSAMLKRHGYDLTTENDADASYQHVLRIYRHSGEEPLPKMDSIATIEAGDGGFFLVLFENEAELIAYWHRFALTHDAPNVAAHIQSLNHLATRAFIAWHGHDADYDCGECRTTAESYRRARQIEKKRAEQAEAQKKTSV
jgi:hypothetical protein